MDDVKKWLVTYNHNDGRRGTVEVETEVRESKAFAYGNRKAGSLRIGKDVFEGYDLRYVHGDFHKIMLEAYFGDGLVEAVEME